jgi:MFS family permease
VTAVLVVTFGRIGDMFGRVRIYNLGFLIFILGSVALSLTWSTEPAGATELIVFRCKGSGARCSSRTRPRP